MDIDLVDYAFFDIIQLRTLYKYYERDLDKYSNLHEESQRYAEIYKARRPGNSIYIEHGLLPQEIFTRSELVKAQNDHLGTRDCVGCTRTLHQDSFPMKFGEQDIVLYCYTCGERKRFIYFISQI